jgi:hypothetical protein
MWPFTRKKQSPQQPSLPAGMSQERLNTIFEKTMGSFFADIQQKPKWRVIDADTLASIPDSELEIAIFDIVWALPISSVDESIRILSDLGIGYQTIYTTIQLETEVGNGGFQQYFHNSTGRFFPFVREGYQRLGLLSLFEIADAAHAQFDIELAAQPIKSRSPEENLEEFMSGHENSAVDTDADRFNAEKKTAKAVRTQFIRSHPELFYGDFRNRYSR